MSQNTDEQLMSLDVLHGRRVVVIDDDPRAIDQADRLLRDAGLVVVASASTGSEGVAAAVDTSADIVLVDVGAGESADLETVRRLLRTCGTCVVALSDWRPPADPLPAGVAGFLIKPLHSITLRPDLRGIYQAWRTDIDASTKMCA